MSPGAFCEACLSAVGGHALTYASFAHATAVRSAVMGGTVRDGMLLKVNASVSGSRHATNSHRETAICVVAVAKPFQSAHERQARNEISGLVTVMTR